MGLYLLVVRYGSEAERKRVEYVLERFRDRVRAGRPQGSAYVLEGPDEEVARVVEELLARVPRENVELYKLEEADIEVRGRRIVLRLETSLRPEEAWGALSLVFARLRGTLVSSAGNERVFVLRPRGGVARARVQVSPLGGGSLVRVVLEGYGSSLDRISLLVEEELRLLGVVRRER